jgi:acetyl-CoA carboxylase, biotin carboxylase subunit
MFIRVLVGNRGECAVRIIRTVRKLGMDAVAVYTEDDKSCRHVREADSAYLISDYMDISAILKAARKCKADAIHPGWGFKSEDPNFPKRCEKAGVVFIGPTEEVMKGAGNKETCRNVASELEVPTALGSPSHLRKQSLKKWARENGLSDDEDSTPYMIKAVAGAGGGGNEIVYFLKNFDDAIARISGRSARLWKNQRVFLERVVEGGSHVEVQFARSLDSEGNGRTLLFGTRECSVQWMYQKVLEIAPAPRLASDQEEKLYSYTRLLVESMNYVGVGTVEFLITCDGIVFLEINPRLQVEHGVSELITGYDFVEVGIRIAAGEMLSISQEDVQINGCAVEVRVNTQKISSYDQQTLVPTDGTVTGLILPNGGYVRVDHALDVDYAININYNPTQAKIMAWSATYEEAVQRLLNALKQTRIEGVETNIPLLCQILQDPIFQRGEYDTTFLPSLLERLAANGDSLSETPEKELVAVIAVSMAMAFQQKHSDFSMQASQNQNSWRYYGRVATMLSFSRGWR